MDDREEEDLGRDDSGRKRRSNRKVPTARNPKAAGRPSKEVVARRTIEEFTANPERWLRANAPEWFANQYGRLAGDERGDKGNTPGSQQRIFKGMARGILETIGFRKKEIDRLPVDALDEFGGVIINEIKPSKAPALWKFLGPMIGAYGWYMIVETRVKEDLYNQRQWDQLNNLTQKSYFHVVDVEGVIHAYKWKYPRVLHTLEIIIKYILRIVGGFFNFFTGLEDVWDEIVDFFERTQKQMLIENGTIIPLEEEGYITPDPATLADDTGGDTPLNLLERRMYRQFFLEAWNEALVWLYTETADKKKDDSCGLLEILDIKCETIVPWMPNWNHLRDRDFKFIIDYKWEHNEEPPYFYFVREGLYWHWDHAAPWYRSTIVPPEEPEGDDYNEAAGVGGGKVDLTR